MRKHISRYSLLLALLAAGSTTFWTDRVDGADIESIKVVVVIYAENRSFDHLYGLFPGANGLQNLSPAKYQQRDRDGSILKELPPIWGGLTAEGVTPAVTQAQTAHLPNKPFAIDDPKLFNTPASVVTNDPRHGFYENQMRSTAARTTALSPIPMWARW